MKLFIKILIHSIFWIVFLAFTTLVSIVEKGLGDWTQWQNVLPHIVINTIWAAIIFYLFYFYFIRLFERRQFVKYLIYSITFSILIVFCFLPLHKLIFPQFDLFSANAIIPPVIGSFILAQCGSLVRGFENWFSNMWLKAELENRNLRNELELLKSQVNPHFLFNTLNNIDSLIHSSPPDASRALITLSDILRYMVYETQAASVPLHKETDYIMRYVELQRLRFRNPEAIRLTIDSLCHDDFIAPMLFVPFIENAFKYAGHSGILPVVDISLSCVDKQLIFFCFNYYDSEGLVNKREGGFGLENVKRRLQLLYPQKHQLQIKKENNTFSVELNIQL